MKRWIFGTLALIALIVLIGWRLHVNKLNADALAPAGGKGKGPISVKIATAKTRDIEKSFEATANIESPQTVKISPKLTALIDSLTVHEGDHVRAGQVLVRLDQSEVAANVRKMQGALAEAKARLVQAKATQNTVTVGVGTTIDQQVAAVSSAQANYNQTKQNLAANIAAADAAVTDAQGRVDAAKAAVANAQAAIRNAQANYNNANSKLTRLESLYKQNFIAAQDVDDQRTLVSVQSGSVDVAQAQLNSAQASLASALAQKNAAQQQADIARTKGQADVDASHASLVQAQAALVNAKANTAQKPAYVANLQALAATVASAQADLTNAEVQLSQTVLTSPIDGYVTSRLMDPGSMASLGNPILEIQAVNQVWANAPVGEEQIAFIQPDMPATITVDTLPGQKFVGRVVQINPSADPSSRQFTVRVALDNAKTLLKPGMFARATFVTQKASHALAVPPEAIETDTDGSSYVWVDNAQSQAEKHVVTTGLSDDTDTQILSGLNPGDKVVTMFTGRMKDGADLKVGKKKGAAGASGGAATAADASAPAPASGEAPASGSGAASAPAGATGAETPASGGKHHHHKHTDDAAAPAGQ